MARNLTAQIDAISEQLGEIRGTLMKHESASSDNASSYLAPIARKLVSDFRHEGYDFSDAVRRNPTAATGALVGALALGTVIGLLLSSSGSSRR